MAYYFRTCFRGSTFEERCVEALRPPALKTLLNVVQFLWSLMKFCLKKSNNFHAVDFSRVESMLAQGDVARVDSLGKI